MSIFGTIMFKIFGSSTAETSEAPAPSPSGDTTAPSGPSKENETPPPPAAQPEAAAPSSSASAAPSTVPSSVDIAQVLDGMEEAAGQKLKLDWRHSIVDLMKLLHMDSSHEARKQLAEELHYPGDMNDSSSMNMWLHREVMKKLADNGGKLPADMH